MGLEQVAEHAPSARPLEHEKRVRLPPDLPLAQLAHGHGIRSESDQRAPYSSTLLNKESETATELARHSSENALP
eukprot:COSAG06_NODE_92_length_24690_cov_4.684071_1_plen_75_part_00